MLATAVPEVCQQSRPCLVLSVESVTSADEEHEENSLLSGIARAPQVAHSTLEVRRWKPVATPALLPVLEANIAVAVRQAGVNAAFDGPGTLWLPNVRWWLERQQAVDGVDVSAFLCVSFSAPLNVDAGRSVRTCSSSRHSIRPLDCGTSAPCPDAAHRGPRCSCSRIRHITATRRQSTGSCKSRRRQDMLDP